ncbi:hypothetical protein PoB_003424300 [Plakobranchus ocellatus]|uniref:Uncharacterized protein n=1 Tax=Plakobranchus ocellatus TaxID=259542 RepID=A0AAV4AMD6_9GAST|nr:hypothetical protein PoB_003424300 [Plakobranchus ocellatus]
MNRVRRRSSIHPSQLTAAALLQFAEPPVYNKVISGFQALRQARAPVAGLEPATGGSLQISGQTHQPLRHRPPHTTHILPGKGKKTVNFASLVLPHTTADHFTTHMRMPKSDNYIFHLSGRGCKGCKINA